MDPIATLNESAAQNFKLNVEQNQKMVPDIAVYMRSGANVETRDGVAIELLQRAPPPICGTAAPTGSIPVSVKASRCETVLYRQRKKK
jgi:hypothetical protein